MLRWFACAGLASVHQKMKAACGIVVFRGGRYMAGGLCGFDSRRSMRVCRRNIDKSLTRAFRRARGLQSAPAGLPKA